MSKSFCKSLLFLLFVQVAVFSQTPTILELNKPITSEIKGNDTQKFQINLAENQYSRIVIFQKGIDLTASLLNSTGTEIFNFDNESRTNGEEIIEFVSETAGAYDLRVEAKYKLLPKGSYQIILAEVRTANEKDNFLQESRKLFFEAIKLRQARKSQEAQPIALRALEILEKQDELQSLFAATMLNFIGNLYYDTNENPKSEEFYQKALSLRKKLFGEDHPAVAQTINDMGAIYRRSGERAKAISLYRQALLIREKSLGTEHPDVATTLNSLANTLSNDNKFIEAEALYQRALNIREKTLGENHPSVASVLNNLALLYEDLGEYGKAETIYLRGLDISEKRLPSDHPDIGTYCDNLAGAYRKLGNLLKSEMLYKRALAIREKALGAEDLLVAATLNNLGILYKDKKDFAESEKSHRRSLAIRQKKLKADHPLIAQSLYNLGDTFWAMDDLLKGEEFLTNSLMILEKNYDASHPNLIYPLSSLAPLYRDKGEYEKSEKLYLRAISILDNSFGKNHPNRATILNGLALLYLLKGDLQDAVKTQTEANLIYEKNISYNLGFGSEQRKILYLSSLSENFDRTLTLDFLLNGKNESSGLAFETVLRRKGRVLDAMSGILSVLRNRFNTNDRILLDDLNETNTSLALTVLNPPNKSAITEHQKNISNLEEKRDKLEAEISRRAEGAFEISSPITVESVQKNLPANAKLIEFAAYNQLPAKGRSKSDETHYVAYIIGNQGGVLMKNLGRRSEIDLAVKNFRQSLQDPKSTNSKQLARELDEKIMSPIREALGNSTQLLISPDGELNLIPFEALIDKNGKYLVENYSISYLSSGRDLLRMQNIQPNNNSPMILANPAFGEFSVAQNIKTSNGKRNVNVAKSLAETYFAPLSGTEKEGQEIKKLFPNATLLTGEKANENALKQTKSPSILHIATHGFFIEPDEKSIENGNPLLRSGLALAGANSRSEKETDGIFTALEGAGLNLFGTKLVVLSACGTGLGDVQTGEGVFGLRRSFVLAGSESLVISLWSVSDYIARELMVNYYKNLKQGLGRGESLRKVQLEMLKNPKRQHPFYWASFIQSGNWKELENIK